MCEFESERTNKQTYALFFKAQDISQRQKQKGIEEVAQRMDTEEGRKK